MVNICFLLLILIILTLVGHSVADQPTWPTSCSMSLYTGKWPRATAYSTSYPGSESLCRGKCEGDSRCGMYKWIISHGTHQYWCLLYHTSLELVTKVLGVEEGEMMASNSRYNIGSKKCEGVIYDHNHCPEYPKHYEGKYIASRKHQILRVYPTTSLTPSQCQHLCSTYSQCRSVRHYVDSSSSETACHLSSTTITELVESGKENEVVTDPDSTTYERYCGDVPYDPSTTETTTIPSETTTPPLDCSNLSTLDGATLCLPINHADEATCQAIPGCCFVEVGGLVPFTMCIKQNYC